MLCPWQQPFLNRYIPNHFASLVKLGRASHPHLFELDPQRVDRIYGGLHLR